VIQSICRTDIGVGAEPELYILVVLYHERYAMLANFDRYGGVLPDRLFISLSGTHDDRHQLEPVLCRFEYIPDLLPDEKTSAGKDEGN